MPQLLLWTMIALLWATMLLSPFFLLILFLPRSPKCPMCEGTDTIALQKRWMGVVRQALCVRWCLSCGWEGLARCFGASYRNGEPGGGGGEKWEGEGESGWLEDLAKKKEWES